MPGKVPVARRSRETAVTCSVLALVFSLSACDGADRANEVPPEVVRRDSSGLEIVLNRSASRPYSGSLRELVDLGSVERSAEAFHDLPSQPVTFGPNGGLFVLDAGNHRIVSFDRDGDHRLTFGARGEGPGHLRHPVAIWSRGDTVEVLDWSLGRIVRYTTEGESLPSRPLDVVRLGIEDRVRPTDRGLVFTTRGGFRDPDADSTHVKLVRAAPGDTQTLATMARAGTRMARFPACRLRVEVRPVFEPDLAWDASDAAVVTSTTVSYELKLIREGEFPRLIRRDIPPEAVDRGDAVNQIGETVELAGCRIPGPEMAEKRGFRNRLQAVDEVRLDPAGRIWVRRNAVGGGGPIDLFSHEGVYLGTLAPGTPYPVAFDGTDRFAATSTDSLDVPRVHVFALETGDSE